MKRCLFIVLILLMLSGCSSTPETLPSEPQTVPQTVPQTTTALTGWVRENGRTQYLREDGSLHTGWLEENGQRYYFDESGTMQTGWLTLNEKEYYLRPDGTLAQGAVQINDQIYHFTTDGEPILLVNPWTFLPEDYAPDLVETENGYWVDSSCNEALLQMLRDCREAGHDARICSAYRENELQVYLYNNKVNYFLGLGYSEEDAKKEAGTIVAVPGTSEHQLGLAVDLVDINNWNLDESQESMPAQKWLMENSWRYGFILRYPNDKSEKTGIIYEPWHYRYVGLSVAQELHESGQCLEEYLDNLTQ